MKNAIAYAICLVLVCLVGVMVFDAAECDGTVVRGLFWLECIK